MFGDIDTTAARVEELKWLVLAGTATARDKEELMLLSWGAYVIQVMWIIVVADKLLIMDVVYMYKDWHLIE